MLLTLRLFLKVMELSSISAAARELDVSPAVASKRLQNLEEELGVRLFNRNTRALSPTTEGLRLSENARHSINELHETLSSIGQSNQDVKGTLQITSGISFGQKFLVPILPEFLETHSKLDVHLNLDDHETDINAGGYDLAIRVATELRDSNLVARKLASAKRQLHASPKYLQKFGTPHSVTDLAYHQCLLLTEHNIRQQIWTLKSKTEEPISIRVGGPIQSNIGEAIREASIRHLGIALLSNWHTYDDVKSGLLNQIIPEYYAETGIYAMLPQRRLTPLRAKLFISFLNTKLKQHPHLFTCA